MACPRRLIGLSHNDPRPTVSRRCRLPDADRRARALTAIVSAMGVLRARRDGHLAGGTGAPESGH
jgi:hypothetical protein